MKLKFIFLPLFLTLISISLNAQTDVFGNKIPSKKKNIAPIPANYNQTDQQGLKQGPWEKRYTDGSPLYKASFKDDKPVGKYTRYYPDGQMSLEIIFDEQGKIGKAKLFNEEGQLVSAGQYHEKNKIGLWTYYTGKEIKLSTTEYVNNEPHGQSIVYYKNGETAEIIHWKYGVKHGEWLKYFENKTPLLKATFINGKLEGQYLYYYKSGQLEIDANYSFDKENKKWTFYLPDGKVNYVLEYNHGTLLNPEVLDERKEKERQEFEQRKDKLKDPEKMRNNPELFMK